MLKKIILISMIVSVSLGIAKLAQANDDEVIAHTMMMQWDKPDERLTVGPIVVNGDYAIAGWIQGARGGRALLERNEHGWQVRLCGGDNLIKPNALLSAGIPASTTQALIDATQAAERHLSSVSRQKISSFVGIMPIETPSKEQTHEHHH